MLTSVEIRKRFLDFFEKKGHEIVASAPIVIKDDPTLMFTNAGMNQFKDLFLGNAPIVNARIADTQKCLRVSGKHNDLDEVGHDTYHHTMFEMLGNWSFGDYFKKEAIEWAWELLTVDYKLNPEDLYVTVFEGDEKDGLSRDEEAAGYWSKLVPAERIIDGNKKDNFWEMGESGPCGPASEIHIDLRSEEEKKKVSGRSLVNQDHPQVVEIWNLVFMQFNRKANGDLENLPAQHVDTGMGFERLCMALQKKTSNYDTDVFQPIIEKISFISGKKYGAEEKTDIALRVIADHVRAVAFSIADGQLPSNTGAGYVIRRILRRAIRYGYNYLELNQPFMHQLVEGLAEQMGPFFPEIVSQKSLIEKVIHEEETGFLRTITQGLVRLDQIISESKSSTIDGALAFELYDTFGFPVDLTSLILREKGLSLDEEGFTAEMEKQKSRSRAATSLTTDDWVELMEDEHEEFVGYDELSTKIKVVKYRKVVAKKKEFYQLIFNLTPFYPEGGGQVGDTGTISNGEETVEVFNTKKENGKIVHFVNELPKEIKFTFTAAVNSINRNKSARNHSATHLLHQILREELGDHVEQKGSLVSPDHLRFDFSHFQKVTDDQLNVIERKINRLIRENISLEEFRHLPIEEAKEMGAMALFGEKYGDTVRAIKFGDSIELCGGTHVSATGQIGVFKFIHESAVAAGIRRVEAITGDAAMNYIEDKLAQLDEIGALLKSPKKPLQAVENLKAENTKLQKEIESLLKEKAKGAKDELWNSAEVINNVRFIVSKTTLDAGSIKDLAFAYRQKGETCFMVLGTESEGKAQIHVMVSDDLVASGMHAGKIVKDLAAEINGGGGGQPFFATAGGKKPEGLENAFNKAKTLIP